MANKARISALWLIGWTLTAVAGDNSGPPESSLNASASNGTQFIKFTTAPPAGLDCLNGLPDIASPKDRGLSPAGNSDECFTNGGFYAVLRHTDSGEGYRVSLDAPPGFNDRECTRLETEIRNCINVLPGRSRAYVEAALGIDAPAVDNHYQWRHTPADPAAESASTTEVSLQFADDTLSVMDVFSSTPH